MVAALCAGFFAASGTATLALWSDAEDVHEVSVNLAQVGLSVSKGGASTASQSGEAVGFSVGSAEASALVAAAKNSSTQSGAIAIPFTVTMLGSAGFGLGYSISMDAARADTVMAMDADGPVLFQVSSPVTCTVAAAQSATLYTPGSPINGIGSNSSAQTTSAHYWCLVIEIDVPMYTNTATAQGSDVQGNVEASSSTWTAFLTPDPTKEPDLHVMVTPQVDAAGCTV
jgi:hypothetical protein